MNESYVVGQALPRFTQFITQDSINLYARASGDFNPIHVDQEFAKKSAFGGVIAHGMLGLSGISAMMTNAFGKVWLDMGSMNVRFKAPARPGDTITVKGEVQSLEPSDSGKTIRFNVSCVNQKDETIITGEASVRIPR